MEEKLKDYEIKREGEAEILMLKSNAVFFNPVQVSSRLVFVLIFLNGAVISVTYLC